MKISRVLFGHPSTGSRSLDAGLLVFRLVAGLALVSLHGLGKFPPSEGFVGMVGGIGFPAPGLFAWLAALAETVGAVLLALGLLTRPAALFLTGHFTFVVLMAHAGDTIADRELPILFLATAILFLLAGPGRFSVDEMIERS